MTPPVVVVLCTVPATGVDGRLGADDLAHRLVDEGLCACVNVVPGVVSFYRWQGAVERAEERLLVIKTRGERLPALREALPPGTRFVTPAEREVQRAERARQYGRRLAQ